MKQTFSSLLPIRNTDTVILDTDICPDCDDCGALAVLVDGCKNSGAKLGAVINNVDNIYGCGAIDAILSYYGVTAPIGMTMDKGFFADCESRYNRVLSEQFSENFKNGTLSVRPALEVYRETLRNSDDHSVILITIGFLNTAAEILAAEPELFAAKVRCVVSMAGNFVDLSHHECNIVNQIPAAQTFFHTCPVPVFFNGFELGISFKTGFSSLIAENPVSVAYDLYSDGYNYSFDPAAVDFAFNGIGEDWNISSPLTVHINDDSTLSVQEAANGLHTSVKFADEGASERVRLRLNRIYAKGNVKRRQKKSYRNFNLAIYCPVYDIKDIQDFEEFDWKFRHVTDHMNVGRVYLENFRSMTWCSKEQLIKVKEYFESKGIAVSGGITTNSNSRDYNISLCYSDDEGREILRKAVAMHAEVFDELIFDDFFFLNCRCPKCIEKRGNRSWSEFRLEEKRDLIENIVLKTAKEINPDINVIVKFPNWYEDFNEVGYDIAMETNLFDSIYTGTETRNPAYSHQHLPKYLSYFFMRHLNNVAPGKNLGGWFDPYECTYNLTSYLEQAYLTLFAKTPEVTLYALDEMINTTDFRLFAPAIGELLREADEYLDQLDNPMGVAAYLPTNAKGELIVHNYLGMCGIPFEPTITYPENEPVIFLAEGAAEDKDIVQKMKKSLLNGADVVVTSGFVRKLGADFREFANISYTTRKLMASEYSAAKKLSLVGIHPSNVPVLIPQLDYGINDVWELAAAYGTDANFPIVLRFGYGNGNVSVITIPDNTGDMYHYPAAVWEVIRRQLLKNMPVTMEGPSKIQMFLYDNHKVIIRSNHEHFEYVTLVMDKEIREVKDLVSKTVWPVVDGRVTLQVAPSVNYVLDLIK